MLWPHTITVFSFELLVLIFCVPVSDTFHINVSIIGKNLKDMQPHLVVCLISMTFIGFGFTPSFQNSNTNRQPKRNRIVFEA